MGYLYDKTRCVQKNISFGVHSYFNLTQPAITCSKLIIETLEQKCEICSKLTIKTPERRQLRRSGVFIVNCKHISHIFLVFLLLTLNK